MRINLSSAAFVFDKFPAFFNYHTCTAKSTDHIFSDYLFVFSKSMNCSLFGLLSDLTSLGLSSLTSSKLKEAFRS